MGSPQRVPLHVLLVDDVDLDAELIERELARIGYDVSTCRARSHAELTADHRCTPDLVILDYTVPGLPGEDSLRIALTRWEDVPVIFVTGTIGEERAVELLRRGATDYVLKDRLSRLDVVVRRALKEAADRSDVERLQAGVRAFERLELIALLAGGIAHDFKNLILAADGFAELAQSETDPGAASASSIAEVRENLARAAALTEHLLLVGRQEPQSTAELDAATVITDLVPTLRRLLTPRIQLEWDPQPDIGAVIGEQSQLEQVLINLVANARDAMPDGGTVRLEAHHRELRDEGVPPGGVPGHYVEFSVSDDGTGMTSEVQRHVFELFFTTKAPGTGTGLGLASVLGIMTRAGGSVEVESTVGVGSTFRILWPMVTPATA